MKSILELFKQGMGPSSTLNLVPYRACLEIAREIRMKRSKINHVEVYLYNEFARLEKDAGISHDIDYAFSYSNFKYAIFSDRPCPATLKNTPYVFDVVVFSDATTPLYRHRVVASGGGHYYFNKKVKHDTIPMNTFEEVKKWFSEHKGATFLDFACLGADREEIKSLYYRAINLAELAGLAGLRKHGELKLSNPDVHYVRQARNIWLHDENFLSPAENANRILSAFSYAISEEINEKAVIIAAPNLCTTAIFWAMALYLLNDYEVTTKKMINAFCAASIFAGLVDSGASLAPIDVGCQGPIGTACGMAAVLAAVVLYDADIYECGRAFEMALEHSLGIICDSLNSYPIIPCIQRCASFATRAYEIAVLNHSLMSTPELCKLDDLIKVIGETGGDLIAKNRRLGMGGFADHASYSLKAATAKDWE